MIITSLLSTARSFRPLACTFRSSRMSMSSEASSTLVGKTCLTVKEAIAAHGNVKFLDGSWYLKGRNSRQEFEDGPRIEGADYFDIDDTASTGDDLNPKNLPHMMPPPKLFAAAMDAMGITNDDTIVIYGNKECVRVYCNFNYECLSFLISSSAEMSLTTRCILQPKNSFSHIVLGFRSVAWAIQSYT